MSWTTGLLIPACRDGSLADMLFYEPVFLNFFCAFYAIYLLATGSLSRRWILLFASVFFYAWGEPAFVVVLIASSLIDYLLALRLTEPAPLRERRLWLALGIVLNLGMLAFYKYADFIITNLNALLTLSGTRPIALLHLALPIGVSFVPDRSETRRRQLLGAERSAGGDCRYLRREVSPIAPAALPCAGLPGY